MKKIVLLLPVVFIISCFGNSVIIDEEKVGTAPKDATTTPSETIDASESSTAQTAKDFEKRNTLKRLDASFSAEDIEVFEDVELIGSGIRTYSSEYAKKVISEKVANNADLTFIVYFAFDSNTLDESAMSIIKTHKDILTKYPDLQLRLEGHTDPKGSREYNLALGELRAIAVQQNLKSDAEYVSFGEEKTVSNDDVKNRRVEIIYK